MKAQKSGRIVNVSSFAGRNFSRTSGPQYSAAKAGILGLTKHMAVELGPFGICVNSVAPSIVLTARVKAKWEARPPEEQRAILAALPLRRLAMPEEVATVIAVHADFSDLYLAVTSLLPALYSSLVIPNAPPTTPATSTGSVSTSTGAATWCDRPMGRPFPTPA